MRRKTNDLTLRDALLRVRSNVFRSLGRRQERNLVARGERNHLRRVLLLHRVDCPEQIVQLPRGRHPEDAFVRLLGLVEDPVRNVHRQPDQVALAMLASTVLALLTSGRYHIYRGVLSGEGHALSSAFARCMLELQQRGYQTEAQTEQALRLLRDDINTLG
jgi:hypothetical protein